jgi:hypothetical protein
MNGMDERDALTREAAFVNAAMAIYGPEYRSLREPGGCQPCVERGDWAPQRVRPNRMPILRPLPFWSVFDRRRWRTISTMNC